MASITIIGNVGKDPESRYTPKGTMLCRFSVADNERDPNDKTKNLSTTWYRVTVWGDRAEAVAARLQKGTFIKVEGTLYQHSYDKDGETRYSLDVTGWDIKTEYDKATKRWTETVCSGGKGQQSQLPAESPDDEEQLDGFEDNSIPF